MAWQCSCSVPSHLGAATRLLRLLAWAGLLAQPFQHDKNPAAARPPARLDRLAGAGAWAWPLLLSPIKPGWLLLICCLLPPPPPPQAPTRPRPVRPIRARKPLLEVSMRPKMGTDPFAVAPPWLTRRLALPPLVRCFPAAACSSSFVPCRGDEGEQQAAASSARLKRYPWRDPGCKWTKGSMSCPTPGPKTKDQGPWKTTATAPLSAFWAGAALREEILPPVRPQDPFFINAPSHGSWGVC